MTLSGQLCCPRHTKAVVGPDDTVVYLSPDDVEKQRQQTTINMILSPFVALFQDNIPTQPTVVPAEENKPSIVNIFRGPVMLLLGNGKKKLPNSNSTDDTNEQET
jgi:hypothetical protein